MSSSNQLSFCLPSPGCKFVSQILLLAAHLTALAGATSCLNEIGVALALFRLQFGFPLVSLREVNSLEN